MVSRGHRYKRFVPGEKIAIPPRVAEVGDRVEIWHEPRHGYPKVEIGTVEDIELVIWDDLEWKYNVLLDRMTKPAKRREPNLIRVTIVDRKPYSFETRRPEKAIKVLERGGGA